MSMLNCEICFGIPLREGLAFVRSDWLSGLQFWTEPSLMNRSVLSLLWRVQVSAVKHSNSSRNKTASCLILEDLTSIRKHQSDSFYITDINESQTLCKTNVSQGCSESHFPANKKECVCLSTHHLSPEVAWYSCSSVFASHLSILKLLMWPQSQCLTEYLRHESLQWSCLTNHYTGR